MPRQSLVVEAPEEIDGVPTFGPNQPVTITGGLNYIPAGCLDTKKNDPGPVVISNADIRLSGAGSSTTSVSAFGTLMLGLPLGMTGPSGTLGSGLYTVTYDECQDGNYDPAQDAQFVDAFRVVVPVDAPVIDLGALKDAATKVADTTSTASRILGLWKSAKSVSNAVAARDAAATVRSGSGVLAQVAAGTSTGSLASQVSTLAGIGGSPSASLGPVLGPLSSFLGPVSQYARLIANDPPDPAFAQNTSITPPQTDTVGGNTPDLATDTAAGSTAMATASLEQALLHALERYQGAAAARDGYWAAVHAREIDRLARLLADQTTALGTAMTAAADADAALPALDPDVVAALTAAKAGLSDTQRRDLLNAGLSAGEITAFEKNAAGFDPTLSAATVRTQADALGAALGGARTALTSLADSAAKAATSVTADRNTGPTPPAVSGGGPYTAATGTPVALNATATGGTGPTTYSWDLDGNGTFGDATGAAPTATAGAPGTHVVSVRATDAAGQTAVTHAVLTVTGAATAPAATPAPSAQAIDLGASQTLTVHTDQPVQWLLDAQPPATGNTFTYSPTRLADTGIHSARALIGAPGTARSILDWTLLVRAPDADTDGWNANTDCNDTNPAVHPGQPEIADNGIDDDCNPLTVDGGTTAQTGARSWTPSDVFTLGTAPINPSPDTYGNPSVWELASGNGLDTATYQPLGNYTAAACGIPGLNAFRDPPGLPSASYNGSGGDLTTTAGNCSSPFTIPQGGISVHPYTADVIVRWTSPIDGTVSLTGLIADADTNGGNGIGWTVGLRRPGPSSIAQPLASGTFGNGGSSALSAPSLAGITVSKGSDLVLDINQNGDPNFDLTNVSMTIAETSTVAGPIAEGLDLTTSAGQPVTGTLTASTSASTAPTYSLVEPPLHGSAAIVGDRLTYTPAPGFVGTDTLSTRVTAGPDSSAPVVTHLTVSPTTGPPSISPVDPISASRAPVTREVTAVAPGSTTLTLAATGLPRGATFQDIGGGHGLITVDPGAGIPGTTTATITATADAGATTAPAQITIAGNRAPVVTELKATTAFQAPATLTAQATDPDGDPLTYAVRTPPAHGTVTTNGATFTYTPAAGYSGPDGFVFAVSDGTAATSAAALITVGAAPSPPPPTCPLATLTKKETADLSLSLTMPATLKPGTTATVIATVCNAGPATANRVATGITLPRGLTLKTIGPGVVDKDRTALAAVAPSLAPGAALTYTLTVTADRTARGPFTVRAGTVSATPDPNLLNNAVLRSIKTA